MPKETDNLSKQIWIYQANIFIRKLKQTSFWISDGLLKIKSSEEIIWKARDVANQANQAINTTKNAISTKIDQTNKIIRNWEKVINATNEFKNSISDLSSSTWSNSWSAN